MKTSSLSSGFLLPGNNGPRAGFRLLPRRCAAARWFLLLGLCLFTVGRLDAAPYPPEGLATEWVQPNGTRLELKVFGDEFYARTATGDGYTVVFNTKDKTYYYAKPGRDGTSLVASRVPADRPPPKSLKKNLKEAKAAAAAIRAANVRKFAPAREAEWAARVRAAQQRRAAFVPGANPAPGGPLGAPIAGAKVGLMILVQFPNDPATAATDPVNFPTTQTKMTRYCNETGYTDDGNTGSIRDYYTDQSNGLMTLTHLITPIVTLPYPRNYYNYSDYPTNATVAEDLGGVGRRLVADAIAKLKTDGFDFSSLTLGSGNRVIATSLLFAGPDSGVWPKGLWPHAFFVNDINVGTAANPRYIYSYQITNVFSSAAVIGTVCHELGHMLLGYPDLYDYGGESEGVGEHCLMGSGNHLNGGRSPAPIDLYLKDVSGWANIIDVAAADQFDVGMPSTGNRGYRIRKPGQNTEYFLVENRGPGDKWAQHCPDQGIAIWHIDEAVSGNGNQEMTAALHYQVSVEQADGLFDLENRRDRGDNADLFDNNTTAFNNGTNPNANWWSGAASGISIAVLSQPAASTTVRFGASISTATLTLDPVTRDVPAASGTYDFTVTSNTSWSWSGNPAWITSPEAANQSGNQTFTYSVAANPSATSRTATLTLSGGGLFRTHTITQAGVVPDDHGDSTATATLVGQNSTTAGNIGVAGDNDYFRINIGGSGTLLVQTTGTSDTYGYLLNGSGAEITSDDDSGESVNFLFSRDVTAGTYYVRVRNFYPLGTGAYQLVCAFTATPSLMVNPATQLATPQAESYGFSVASNLTWSWSVDADWIVSNEDASQTGDQSFTYLVRANTTSTARVAVITVTGGGITRTHTVTQAAGTADDHGNSMGTATLIAANSTIAGNIGAAGDIDYFRMDVGGLGALLIQTTGSTDTYGLLYDASGALLAFDDDAGADANFQISRAVTAGTYYVAVRHFSSFETGSYQLVCTFTAGAALAVSSSSLNIQAVGAVYAVDVMSNTAWSWSSNVPWLTSAVPANQSGSQSFSCAVLSNTGASSRTGVITFAAGALTATLTVVQNAGSGELANRLIQTLPGGSESVWTPVDNYLGEATLQSPPRFHWDALDGVGLVDVQTRAEFGNVTATNAWGNRAVPPQSGTFSASFKTTPNGSAVDTAVGFCSGAADFWDDLAAYVRFNDQGKIDARNGGGFAAVTNFNYVSGVSYLVEMEINVVTKRYRATVTPAGGSPVVIANDYAFRTEQNAITQINNFAYLTYTGGTQAISGLVVPALGSVTATNVWGNYAVPRQSKYLTASFRTIPSSGAVDTSIGFSSGAADFWDDLAAYVRFNDQGKIDARNGSGFAAAAVLGYSGGVSYRVNIEIDVEAKRYWATVTPAGGSPVLIANNYAFRTEQNTVTQLSNFAYLAWTGGTQKVEGLVVSDFSPVTATTAWGNHPVNPQTGTFVASFTTVPSTYSVDSVIGFSNAAADFWDDLAAYVRFNPSGTIDARNENGFSALSTLTYAPGISYLVEMSVNVPAKRYSATVTPAGGSPVLIAYDFAFRTEQIEVTQLSNFVYQTNSGGTQSVSGLAISGNRIDLPSLAAPNVSGPLSATNTASETRVTKEIRLVTGCHATDEIVTVENLAGEPRSVSLQLLDNYGSDSATVVHATSSGNQTVGPEDRWFVSNDRTSAGDISSDPTLMVSWRFTGAMASPVFSEVPGNGSDRLRLNFSAIMAGGATATISVRRQLFETAAQAIAEGVPLSNGDHLQAWRQSWFGTGENSGMAANLFDFDRDGLVNLLEYAFGLVPTSGSSCQTPQGQWIGGNFVISFAPPAGVAAVVVYGAEWSATMASGDWHAITDTGTGGQHVFIAPGSPGGKMFVRLTVSSSY